MRILTGVFAVILILFAVAQYNDPDALYWAAIYGVAALLSAYAALRPERFAAPALRGVLTLALVLSVVGVVWYWPTTAQWWRVDVWWNTETAREGMGMMVVAVALLIAWWTVRLGGRVR